ncbi:MAG: hypothetical protein AAGF27_05060 [Pseudomonadota bacterium]
MSQGFFIIDEAVYWAGVEAFWRTGTFIVANGQESFASENLRLWLFSDGPKGLTPQYPIGTAVAALPFIDVFGQRSLIFLNVLAGIGTLLLTYALAVHMFATRTVASLALVILATASFWPEYVLAHWPHSISIFWVILAVFAFVVANERVHRVVPMAFLSGLALGIGMFFRLEAVLALPGFTAAAILLARRPVLTLLGGFLGLLPAIALMILSNDARFGTLSPLSYGSHGGATDLSKYIVLAAGVAVVLMGLTLARLADLRPKPRDYGLLAIGLMGCLIVVALSPYGNPVSKFLRGTYAILVDSTTINDPRPGVQPLANGTQLFWGLAKKALGQSLPWLGCLVLLASSSLKQHRRNICLVLIISLTWCLPFVIRGWHGGLGSNMRYLLPTLPLMAMLAALVLRDLMMNASRPRTPYLIAAVACGSALVFIWPSADPQNLAFLHQKVTRLVLAGVTLASIAALFVHRDAYRSVALVLTCAALGLSGSLNYSDIKTAQERRGLMERTAKLTATLPGPILFYATPGAITGVFQNEDHVAALPHPVNHTPDADLIADACAKEHQVILAAGFRSAFEREGYSMENAIWSPNALTFFRLDCTRLADRSRQQ